MDLLQLVYKYIFAEYRVILNFFLQKYKRLYKSFFAIFCLLALSVIIHSQHSSVQIKKEYQHFIALNLKFLAICKKYHILSSL